VHDPDHRVQESEQRRRAILDAASDCIVTMDARGYVVEVNPATERMFGYTAEEMVGRELAELIVPPELREAHRRGVERYVATGESTMVGHPVELPAMRADGSQFPVEIAITRPQLSGPPLFTGFLRDVTERKRDEAALRKLADEQAALRRVATVVARADDPERVFAVVTEEIGRLLGANTSNMVRFEADGSGIVTGEWSRGDVRAVPVGTHVALDGPTVVARIRHSGRPERVDSYDDVPGSTAELLRDLGFRSSVGAPVELAGRLWGAMTVSTVEDTPFPEGAEQRLADFAELVSVALANASAREELAASRARIVEAGDAERRRIERNLHDGAQQRLVSLSLHLRVAERKLADVAAHAADAPDGGSSGVAEACELLRGANQELSDALEELRELARGIHPAILTDRGLVPALEMLAGRASIPVELCAELERQLPRPVEAAAYYVVSEALTNASKHARASRLRVNVSQDNGSALVEVADDGVGGADPRTGTGLRGLVDRVEALGGRLEVVSPAGEGTTLTAWLPAS
jgi:PAS domain S-box-containing protein